MKLILFTFMILLPSALLANNDIWQKYENEVRRLSSLKMDKFLLKDYDFEAAAKSTTKFNCHSLPFSVERPKSVHKLTPGDISVVGAIGDSLTAANGAQATNVIELLKEYRGVSWAIGGDNDLNSVITLPSKLD